MEAANKAQTATQDIHAKKLAEAFASVHLELEKQSKQEERSAEWANAQGIRSSAFRAVLSESSDSTPITKPSKNRVKSSIKRSARSMPRKSGKVKRTVRPQKRDLKSSFSIEMDQNVEIDLKQQLGVQNLPYSTIVYQPHAGSTQASSGIFGSIPSSSTSLHDSELEDSKRTTSQPDAKQGETSGSASDEPLRIRALKSELESVEKDARIDGGEVRARKAKKIPTEELDKTLKALGKQYRGAKAWGWKKIRRIYDTFKPIIKEMTFMGMMMRSGKMAYPKRPPAYHVLLSKQMNKEREIARSSKLEPGVFPKSILTGVVHTQLNEQVIAFVSRRFSARRTGWQFLLYLIGAIMAYEAYLAFDEYYYTKHPEVLSQQLETYLQVDGQFLASIKRSQHEKEWIVENRNTEWRNIQYGWLPDVFWRWILRSEEEHVDPTILLLTSTWSGLKASIANFNLTFFMNNSRFWLQHSYEARFAEKLAESLATNQTLPTRLRTTCKEALRQALDNDMASTHFIQHNGLSLLLNSTALMVEESDGSLEALLLRTAVSSPERVRAFWNLPYEALKENLEVMLVHTEKTPKLVAFLLASLTSSSLPSIDPYCQRLLVSIISMLRYKPGTFAHYVENMAELSARQLASSVPEHPSLDSPMSPFDEFKAQHYFSQSSVESVPNYDFDVESVRRAPSLAWIVISLPPMGLYIYRRYDSNSLWNGLGALPIRLRKVQVFQRALPAVLASTTWFLIDAYWSKIHSSLLYMIDRARIEAAGGANKYQKAIEEGQTVVLPLESPTRNVTKSLVLATPFWTLKIALLWQHPFILMPQIVAHYMAEPIAWFRKWRHRRMQSL